jgi:hypothetical protein
MTTTSAVGTSAAGTAVAATATAATAVARGVGATTLAALIWSQAGAAAHEEGPHRRTTTPGTAAATVGASAVAGAVREPRPDTMAAARGGATGCALAAFAARTTRHLGRRRSGHYDFFPRSAVLRRHDNHLVGQAYGTAQQQHSDRQRCPDLPHPHAPPFFPSPKVFPTSHLTFRHLARTLTAGLSRNSNPSLAQLATIRTPRPSRSACG